MKMIKLGNKIRQLISSPFSLIFKLNFVAVYMLIWCANDCFFDVFIQVQFVESVWRVGNTSGRHPTNDDMIRVLSHLTSLRIRAKWTTSSPSTFLGDIVLTVSNRYRSENFEIKANAF